jgi:hypothetical protein
LSQFADVFSAGREKRMKPLLVATIIGIAAGGLAMQSKTVSSFIGDIYPADPARREALNLCLLADSHFNRLDPDARATCYHHAFVEPPPQDILATLGSAANQVDLRRAASLTSAPRNDVRLVQQSDRSIR